MEGERFDENCHKCRFRMTELQAELKPFWWLVYRFQVTQFSCSWSCLFRANRLFRQKAYRIFAALQRKCCFGRLRCRQYAGFYNCQYCLRRNRLSCVRGMHPCRRVGLLHYCWRPVQPAFDGLLQARHVVGLKM